VTFTVVAVIYLVTCAGLGLARGGQGSNALLTVGLAAAMVCAQLALLLTR
jgi:hypothetical protein